MTSVQVCLLTKRWIFKQIAEKIAPKIKKQINYCCDVCPYTSNYEHNIKRHLLNHISSSKTGRNAMKRGCKYQCYVCDHKPDLRTFRKLRVHLDVYHRGSHAIKLGWFGYGNQIINKL